MSTGIGALQAAQLKVPMHDHKVHQMRVLPAPEAVLAVSGLKTARKYPAPGDPRLNGGVFLPHLKPSFRFAPGDTVFTVGSCFARNIEGRLTGFVVPTQALRLTEVEVSGKGNAVLNEYNPGAIAQRLLWAATGQATAALDAGFGGTETACVDLLLSKGFALPRPAVVEVRRKIDAVYAMLATSDVLIITLGMAEAWYDGQDGLWLNRMPDMARIKSDPGRFDLRILEAQEAAALLEPALAAVIGQGVRKIILTVSPVPLQASFSGDDCIIANSHSKSVMRGCAELLRQRFPGVVDYFPSYEMATGNGLHAYREDLVHVKNEVIAQITDYLMQTYARPA